MSEQTLPVLQKPPGYRAPTGPAHSVTIQPLRKPVLPPSIPPRKERRRGGCCRACCCFLLLLFIIIDVAVGFFYLWYKPLLPAFQLRSLEFTRFNITAGPEGLALNSQAVVRIEVMNPNKVLKLNYKADANLKAEGVDLGSARLPEFIQGTKNTTVLKFTAEVKNYLLENGVVAKKLKEGVQTKSLVVGTVVRTVIGVGSAWGNAMVPTIRVLCGGGMSLKEVERGAVPPCTITVFQWFNHH